jgi:hypothetical protein
MELTTRNQLGGVATILGVGIDTVRRWGRGGNSTSIVVRR